VSKPPDDRSPLAQAIGISSHITAIALEMAVPGLIGLWLDRRLGTVMVFLVLGMILGVVTGVIHMVRFAKSAGSGVAPRQRDEDE
jgi:F0F1-type ATP synthase assembly protein I